ncbi:BZ3500_MvSof-1268-A1-R1_Chr2-2g05078 [Microbotryum saponariae]|uniref:BZ3500_MvSof-1268-A1-R1_Chr2-2g05078 protein n=1 Tax=Microbotryum saponariae TaxID=289078 RepID=A0A2X0N7P8_9BASI|nr:BZ3500_MvSof-1268-A1-R1_Chr2-2g05078 [Microbotryum saponariae]SDA00857.1 BZ3501_MvSof-1269-A2-R1_Chr2-2g04752 [Microbotryum saponariae]
MVHLASSNQQQEPSHTPFGGGGGEVAPSSTEFGVVGTGNRKQLSGRDLDALEKAGGVDAGADASEHRSLRVAIVTENFLPKVDGVTRTLAMLLEHLQKEGHEAIVLGPDSGMVSGAVQAASLVGLDALDTSYAGHEVVGTRGLPLLGVYKGLALNFIRPRFITKLREFEPDVIQFVDPIWLCAQVIPVVQYYLPDVPLLTSYHTNLAMYATLFGFAWLTPTMWRLQRNLHSRCRLTFCPSQSTARMLTSQGFNNVRLWPRVSRNTCAVMKITRLLTGRICMMPLQGVNTRLFRPEARDFTLRQSWSAEPESSRLSSSSSDSISSSFASPRSSLDSSPPSYSSSVARSPQSKVVLLYVGRISWEKNLRLLVEAFRGLEKPSTDGTRPACQLVFVGDGPSRPELENLCAQYGLGAVFMGYRKGEELAAAYASADIFAFPSWTETFGQVVLESLASGLPVVGLRAEGVCDLVEHGRTGLLLDLDELLPASQRPAPLKDPNEIKPLPANPHRLVGSSSATFPLAVSMYRQMLVELASDHARRWTMGQAAHSDASTRSWHAAMEMLVDGYRELARSAAGGPKQIDHDKSALGLSRTSTLDLDIVCGDTAGPFVSELPDSECGTHKATTASAVRRPKRMLRLGGVLRRTGGRFREGSLGGAQTIPSWLGGVSDATSSSPSAVSQMGSHIRLVTERKRTGSLQAIGWIILKVVAFSWIVYTMAQYVLATETMRRITVVAQ